MENTLCINKKSNLFFFPSVLIENLKWQQCLLLNGLSFVDGCYHMAYKIHHSGDYSTVVLMDGIVGVKKKKKNRWNNTN